MIRAVFGGSFDPVHRGHVAMVDRLLSKGLSDAVVLVPAARSPFKSAHAATAEARLAMLRLAFAGRAGVVIDDRELHRPGPSFTVATVEELATDHPSDMLLLVVGQDNLAGLPDWKDVNRLLSLADLCVFARDATLDADAVRSRLAEEGIRPRGVSVVADFQVPVSSSRVRAMLAAHEDVSSLVPAEVVAYISAHGFYAS